MSNREKLERLQAALERKDPAVCGDARRWIIDQTKLTIEEFLAKHPGGIYREEFERFVRSGMRYVAEEAAGETGALGSALMALLESDDHC